MTDVTSETLPMALTKGRDVPRMARELRKGHHGHLREFSARSERIRAGNAPWTISLPSRGTKVSAGRWRR